MLTRVPEEIRRAEKAIDFGEFFSQEPLKFQFYYGENNQAEIINTIYLEDGNKPLTLYLEVFNDSEQDVIFKNSNSLAGKLATVQAGGAQAASEKKCHFQLRWEKDLGLKPSEIEIDGKSGQWQVNYDEESRFFSIYFLHKSGLTLKPNEKIQISFSKLTANNRTVKSSNVELLYGGIGLISTGTANELIEEQVSSKNAVSVINHLRKTEIPLQFRVLGSNAILNDGTTQNTLKLKVLNSPLSNNTRPILLLDQSSKFIVSFEKGTHPDALVATDSQLQAVDIDTTDTNSWTKHHTKNTSQWSFTPEPNLKQLTAGEGIELTISQLVTSSASGLACIYIDYQNIGSYPDGRLVIPIEKTPLLYSGSQVGIGTKTFDWETTKLKVNGDIVLGKDENNRRFRLHTRSGTNEGGEHLQITYDNPSGNWNWNEGITLRRLDGKVGIGTSDPKAKLHVNGNAVINDKVGIGTTTPKIHLAIGDDNTGLHLEDSQNLSLMVKGKQRVAMPHGKPVVISGGLAVGHDSTSIERILCGRVVVRDDIKPMDPQVVFQIKDRNPMESQSNVFFREDLPMGLPWEPQVLFDSDGMALYGNKIDRGFRINTGEFQINFEEPFNSEEVDKAIVLLTSLDGECTVHLLSISPFRVITRVAKTQERKDASFNFVIILPTSSDRKFLGCFK